MIILPFFALQMNTRSMSLAMGEPAMMITLQYGRAQVMVAWLSQPGGNSLLEGMLEKRYWSITSTLLHRSWFSTNLSSCPSFFLKLKNSWIYVLQYLSTLYSLYCKQVGEINWWDLESFPETKQHCTLDSSSSSNCHCEKSAVQCNNEKF